MSKEIKNLIEKIEGIEKNREEIFDELDDFCIESFDLTCSFSVFIIAKLNVYSIINKPKKVLYISKEIFSYLENNKIFESFKLAIFKYQPLYLETLSDEDYKKLFNYIQDYKEKEFEYE